MDDLQNSASNPLVATSRVQSVGFDVISGMAWTAKGQFGRSTII